MVERIFFTLSHAIHETNGLMRVWTHMKCMLLYAEHALISTGLYNTATTQVETLKPYILVDVHRLSVLHQAARHSATHLMSR
jgi:hypothetical protein